MALTTLISGMSSVAFIAAIENNGQYSRYNNSSYTEVTSLLTGTEFINTVNTNTNSAKAEYRFSPSTEQVTVGMTGSQILTILNSNYTNLENDLPLKTSVPMFTFRLDDGTGGDNIWKPYFANINKHFTSCVLQELVGTPGYLTEANVIALSSAGDEIQSHGIVANINLLDDAEKEAALQSTKLYLEGLIGSGKVNGFSVHGYRSLELKPYVKKYYKWNCSWWETTGDPEDVINPSELDILNLQMIMTANFTIDTSWIDVIISMQGWLILVAHEWNQGLEDLLDIIIPYCTSHGVAVVSIEEGIALLERR